MNDRHKYVEIPLRDDVIRKLQKLRRGRHISYAQVLDEVFRKRGIAK